MKHSSSTSYIIFLSAEFVFLLSSSACKLKSPDFKTAGMGEPEVILCEKGFDLRSFPA